MKNQLTSIGCDPAGIHCMQDKYSAYTLKITNIPGYCAIILKQEALIVGAECALPRETIRQSEKNYTVILSGTKRQIIHISEKCQKQAFRILREELASKLLIATSNRPPQTPKIMGILNITPDSFSDGGLYIEHQAALDQAELLLNAGASIIDIGGESTRPDAQEISAAEEMNRVIPIITAIHKKYPACTISIDTTKAIVAKAALQAGATIVNDVSGLTADPNMAKTVAQANATIIIMHRSAPSIDMQNKTQYPDLLTNILEFLQNSINTALEAGILKENIIIDPGIGFGKTTEQNLMILKNLTAFHCLGYPLLLGASRKSVIGATLERPIEGRLFGTIATSLAGHTAQYIRVHDIAPNLDALKMHTAILEA